MGKQDEKKLYHLRAVQLAAQKLHHDYMRVRRMGVVEPESFYEKWAHVNLSRVGEKMYNKIFGVFMGILSKTVRHNG